MKFKFCGDLDAPDWLLKEITVLSKISSVRIRLLCTQVINQLLGGSIDVKQQNFITDLKDRSDVKAAIAALNFILTSSSKYNADDSILSNELQQLGLPKEHCDSLAKPYKDNKDKLREVFAGKSLQLTGLESIEWRVDYLISSSFVQELNSPTVHLKLQTKNIHENENNTNNSSIALELSPERLRVLLHELKAAQEYMESIL